MQDPNNNAMKKEAVADNNDIKKKRHSDSSTSHISSPSISLLEQAAGDARAAVQLDQEGGDYPRALELYRKAVAIIQSVELDHQSQEYQAVEERVPAYLRRIEELEKYITRRQSSVRSGSEHGSSYSFKHKSTPSTATKSVLSKDSREIETSFHSFSSPKILSSPTKSVTSSNNNTINNGIGFKKHGNISNLTFDKNAGSNYAAQLEKTKKKYRFMKMITDKSFLKSYCFLSFIILSAAMFIFAIATNVLDLHGFHRWPQRYKLYGFNQFEFEQILNSKGHASVPSSSSSKENSDNATAERETVVLIPGLNGCTSFYADVIPELTSRGLKVVMFNLPLAQTSGYAVGSAGSTVPYTFEFMASELGILLKELKLIEEEENRKGRQVHIVGESFGGIIAQHFALKYPRAVKTLTLISSLCRVELTPIVKFKITFVLPVVSMIGRLLPGMAQRLFAFFHVSDVVESHEPSWMKDFFIKEASWAHHPSVIARLKIALRLDMCQQTTKIRAPSMVVYGQDDTFTRQSSVELYASLSSHLHEQQKKNDNLDCNSPDELSKEEQNGETCSHVENNKRNVVELVGLPGGHLPHVTSPLEFASKLITFIRRNQLVSSNI